MTKTTYAPHDLSHEDFASERYQAINLHNFESLPQMEAVSEDVRHAIRVVGRVLPFKSNRYVVDHLIDWDDAENDGMFRLTFPQRDMLEPRSFERMAAAIDAGRDSKELKKLADEIRWTLNPHPAGQMEHNVPRLSDGTPLPGMQHKYRETALFFASQGQTCHAYCTFCFRWPQFVGLEGEKFAMREAELLTRYVGEHHEISDVLFTGGDPLIMKTKTLRSYIEPLLADDAEHGLRTIRIGSKAIAYWPHRFVFDDDAEDLLDLFREVVDSGLQLALMAHFNHPAELRTGRGAGGGAPDSGDGGADSDADAAAAEYQRGAAAAGGYVERADPGGLRAVLPVRGAGHRGEAVFRAAAGGVSAIFREAYQRIAGVARTVRGPSMSATPGKVQMLGVSEHAGEKLMLLRFLQGRDPDWVGRPFFAKYNDQASWLDELEPAEGDEFFYEERMRELLAEGGSPWAREDTRELLLTGEAAGGG